MLCIAQAQLVETEDIDASLKRMSHHVKSDDSTRTSKRIDD